MKQIRIINIPMPIEYETVGKDEEGKEVVERKKAVFQQIVLDYFLSNAKCWGRSYSTLALRKEIKDELIMTAQHGWAEMRISEAAWKKLHDLALFPCDNGGVEYNPEEGEIVLPFLEAIKDARKEK